MALNKDEEQLAIRISLQKSMGEGEIQCIAICKKRGLCIVTNDKKAINAAEDLNINVIDLETILFSLKDILGKEEIKKIIEDIESKDSVVIVNKNEILL